jgi:hypothetical protein
MCLPFFSKLILVVFELCRTRSYQTDCDNRTHDGIISFVTAQRLPQVRNRSGDRPGVAQQIQQRFAASYVVTDSRISVGRGALILGEGEREGCVILCNRIRNKIRRKSHENRD